MEFALVTPAYGDPAHSLGASRHLLPGREKMPAATLPARAVAFVTAETEAEVPAREALLDRAMGPGRKRKSSEKLRRGRKPSEGLSFVARDVEGRVVGTVRLWDVAVKRVISPLVGEMRSVEVPALLLGPLAVDPALKGSGIGSALMRHAIEEAARLGHKAILLVGDAPYYARFGFSYEKTAKLSMPGPYERHRFLALELEPGALDGACGVLRAAGRKSEPLRQAGRSSAAA
jgi:predicted N-acetyltransferase YhbS